MSSQILAHHFGEIPGAPVGTTWATRKECYNAGVHLQSEPGIHGTKEMGAFSIVVSGQYKDDKDEGDTIIYTGSGGHEPSDRTREQVRDQEWTDFGNEALRKSSETGNPVRVVRGYELESEFAPWEGFRYDGLYTCTRAWQEKNRDGHYVICRYRMERVPGQLPLRRRSTNFPRYRLLPGEVVQPPAPMPPPVTPRQRIMQQIGALVDSDQRTHGPSKELHR
ncbi:PUA-like domain-containing protein [Suillus fuscotomentosus]|uniref:PUA-like domain-containing protein n=1 Tax=Suillus fuscotomentosus TaxID=1912939 RepID=A0AAD4HL37_9AGAM|nr:PUA-like domain-containing protein [Suillus fuscotomentosus]KAG1899429.1 PUA-like domain-containing protein [Suillus fuscotomentosus]